MHVEFELSLKHLWVGVYWEKWPDPYRVDLWVSFFLFAVHFHWTR